MTCSMFCVKCLYYILNGFYTLLAVQLLVLGIWVAMEPAMQSVTSQTQYPVAYILIGVGVAMVITATIADIAACTISRWLMVVAFIGYVVSLILVAGLIVWVAVSRETLKQTMSTVMSNCVGEYVTQNGKPSTCTALLDTVQNYWSCCGAKSYMDYAVAGGISAVLGKSVSVPSSCGKEISSNIGIQIMSNLVRPGCSDVITSTIDKNFPIILAVAGAQLVFPLGMAILSMTLFRLSKSSGFAPVRT